MAVSKRLRYEVLRRDGHACRYCGAQAPDVKLTVDHVVPVALGGKDEPANLLAACRDCNAGKNSSSPDAPLVAEVNEKAAVWARAMELVLLQRAERLEGERAAVDRFDQVWSSWKYGPDRVQVPRDPTWRASVVRFLAAGLDVRWLTDAIPVAMGNGKVVIAKKWTYFCGVCWTEIRKIQEAVASAAGSLDLDEYKDEFPYMHMFDDFSVCLIRALGGDLQDCKIADHALWMAMPEADRAWREHVVDPEDEDDDGLVVPRAALMGVAVPILKEITDRHMNGADDGAE